MSGSDDTAVLAFLLAVALLGVVLLIGRALHHAKVTWLGEAGAALLLGLLVGLLIRVGHAKESFKESISFKNFIFLDVMLPTIMFDAGYSLDPKPFIRNVGGIALFAFLGTTVSTFIIGGLLYGVGVAGWCTSLPLIYTLLFGAIISATDPVTVLAVFSNLGANEDLYINVFGESALNDAVALVLYDTLQKFVGETPNAGNVFKGIGLFVGIFLGSVAMGLALGFGAAFLFRSGWIQDRLHPEVETGVVVVTAFLSYLCAQAAHMSGICSVIFCGMVVRSFVAPNLNRHSQLRVEAAFKTLSSLFELFLFVYIGLTLFVVDEKFNIWPFAAWTLLALAVSRAANIVPCAALINWLRLPHTRMPAKHQFMMWWSGLRGAMAFALALDAADQFDEPGAIMKTCTFYVVFVTVLVNGGAASYLLERLQLLQTSHRTTEAPDTAHMHSSSVELNETAHATGPDVECAELLVHPRAAHMLLGSAVPFATDSDASQSGTPGGSPGIARHSYQGDLRSLTTAVPAGSAEGVRVRGRPFFSTHAAGPGGGATGGKALRTYSERFARSSPAGGSAHKSVSWANMAASPGEGVLEPHGPGALPSASQAHGTQPQGAGPANGDVPPPERSPSPPQRGHRSALHRMREFNSTSFEQHLHRLSRALTRAFHRGAPSSEVHEGSGTQEEAADSEQARRVLRTTSQPEGGALQQLGARRAGLQTGSMPASAGPRAAPGGARSATMQPAASLPALHGMAASSHVRHDALAGQPGEGAASSQAASQSQGGMAASNGYRDSNNKVR